MPRLSRGSVACERSEVLEFAPIYSSSARKERDWISKHITPSFLVQPLDAKGRPKHALKTLLPSRRDADAEIHSASV